MIHFNFSFFLKNRKFKNMYINIRIYLVKTVIIEYYKTVFNPKGNME